MSFIPTTSSIDKKIKGREVWVKRKLPRSDAQTYIPGTNPTGCLRLSQARYVCKGRVIDQTTYFKNMVFGKSKWKLEKENPLVYITNVLFSIEILGKNIGQYMLEIRHKPSGEAGQGNYTTSISWGDISEFLGDKVIGKDLYLYAPAEGEDEPFYIDIR